MILNSFAVHESEQDDDLVKKNLSACQVYFVSERQIHYLEKLWVCCNIHYSGVALRKIH